jgi:alpha-galactosidase
MGGERLGHGSFFSRRDRRLAATASGMSVRTWGAMRSRRWEIIRILAAIAAGGCSDTSSGTHPNGGAIAPTDSGALAIGSSSSGGSGPGSGGSSGSSGSASASGSSSGSTSSGGGRPSSSGSTLSSGSGSGSSSASSSGSGSSSSSGADFGASSGGADASASGPIAATPPMGWNSWNTFQCNISESLIKATADAMVSSGMQAAGFQYVNIDDCWMNGRDPSGNLQWNASKFPNGIPALAAYVHGKGLKLGIYETPNTVTCVGIYGGISTSVAVGSLGHEAQDAKTFASWGVDYLKYDLCQGQLSSFAVMRDALRATGAPIVYSINPGNGSGCPPTGATTSTCGLNLPITANLWRIAFDINASWSSIAGLIDSDAPLSPYAGPGHWNDPDMLEVGNGSLTDDENKSHFSMWAMLAAPLLAGDDLRSMSSAVQTILTNKEVTAVDQDPLGKQATLVATPQSGLQVWSKTLSGGNVRSVALLNRNTSPASITVTFAQIGLSSGQTASVRDLWQHADVGSFTDSYTAANVPSHGVAMLRIAGP